ncbi:PHP domain-containing protein [Candidatus Omnitrophota bacterium]
MKLVSIGYLEGFYYRPRIDKDVLAQYSKGLIGLRQALKPIRPLEFLVDSKGSDERGTEGL